MNSLTPPTPDPDFQLTGPADDPGQPHSSFRIQRLLPFLLKYWWVPVVTLLIGLSAGLGYVFFKPPTYISKARMWETLKLHLPEGGMFAEDVQNFLGTQTELLQSTLLRERALERLKASKTNVAVPRGTDGEALPVLIRVAGSGKSSVFMIEATSSQAAYTHDYLNALMEVYLEFKKSTRQEVSRETLESLTKQLSDTERELKAQQDIFMAFQRTNNNMAILQQQGTIAGGYLTTLKTRLSDLQLEDRLLKATAAEREPSAGTTNAGPDSIDSSSSADLASSPGAPAERQTASKDIELLKIQRDKLSRYLRPKHPKIVKLDAEIERGLKMIEIFRRQDSLELAKSRRAIQLKMESTTALISQQEIKVVEANSALADAERLKLNVQREQSTYDKLMVLVQNMKISRNIDQDTLQILESASPAKRSLTQEISLLAVAGFGGVGLGVGIILLIALRDDRFTSLGEVNDKLGQVIVGQVPEVLSLQQDSALPLLTIHDERHAYAESFRSLRSAILFMATNGVRPKVILITSALPNEGKSTVAANLARTLALGGARVVLVDGDLRKGTLHSLMGLPREPGLSELLRQRGDLEKILQTNCMPNLAFISSGSATHNSGDLFLGPMFDLLLAHLRQQFDYVLIDSSPVFAADDATTLAPKVDGTLFVVRSRFSRAGPAREALELLYQRQANVLGVIFNQADSSARSYYYYKYAEYQHPEGSHQ